MWQWFAYSSKPIDINSAPLYFFISEIFYPSRLDPVPTLQWLKGKRGGSYLYPVSLVRPGMCNKPPVQSSFPLGKRRGWSSPGAAAAAAARAGTESPRPTAHPRDRVSNAPCISYSLEGKRISCVCPTAIKATHFNSTGPLGELWGKP